MARLYLFAEGPTEQTFADTVLNRHLADYGVFMKRPVLIEHAHKKHRTHRGGSRNFRAMQNDIVRFLQQRREPPILTFHGSPTSGNVKGPGPPGSP